MEQQEGNRRIRSRARTRAPHIITFTINIIIIGLILFMYFSMKDNPTTAQGAVIPWVELVPEDYEELPYHDEATALENANAQLLLMQHGNIDTIDNTDFQYDSAFILDYSIGSVIYWRFSDANNEIYLRADSGEIIRYYEKSWTDGTLSENEAQLLALNIAPQFESIPEDSSDFILSFTTPMVWESTNLTTSISSYVYYSYWYALWNRTKENIVSEDHITIIIDPSGTLHSYDKVWNMNLESLGTTYEITQEEANDIALEAAGPDSVLIGSEKKIVRPNGLWTAEEPQFGLDATCIYEVFINAINEQCCIFQVDGTTGEIVGVNGMD